MDKTFQYAVEPAAFPCSSLLRVMHRLPTSSYKAFNVFATHLDTSLLQHYLR
eukprot:COSAG02_NODE_2559_length_8529_cov_5.446382_7_plen_52_part_00